MKCTVLNTNNPPAGSNTSTSNIIPGIKNLQIRKKLAAIATLSIGIIIGIWNTVVPYGIKQMIPSFKFLAHTAQPMVTGELICSVAASAACSLIGYFSPSQPSYAISTLTNDILLFVITSLFVTRSSRSTCINTPIISSLSSISLTFIRRSFFPWIQNMSFLTYYLSRTLIWLVLRLGPSGSLVACVGIKVIPLIAGVVVSQACTLLYTKTVKIPFITPFVAHTRQAILQVIADACECICEAVPVNYGSPRPAIYPSTSSDKVSIVVSLNNVSFVRDSKVVILVLVSANSDDSDEGGKEKIREILFNAAITRHLGSNVGHKPNKCRVKRISVYKGIGVSPPSPKSQRNESVNKRTAYHVYC